MNSDEDRIDDDGDDVDFVDTRRREPDRTFDAAVDNDDGPTPCTYTEYVGGVNRSVDDLPATGTESEGIERAIWNALSEVEDPEMPISVVDLGLIYGVDLETHAADGETHEHGDNRHRGGGESNVDRNETDVNRNETDVDRDETNENKEGDKDHGDRSETHATVIMTLTYTGCPARSMLLAEVEAAAASSPGVDEADVELVWSPEWSLDMVTEQGKADLREFGLSV